MTVPTGNPKGRPPKVRDKKSRKRLTPKEEETCFQLYASGMNQCEIARTLNCSRQAVHVRVKKYVPADISHARAQMTLEMSGKVTKLAERALDSITDNDFARASLSQKAVVAGIMIDKSAALEKMRNEMLEAGASGSAMNGIPLPGDAAGMIQAIKNRIEAIEVLRIQLRDPEGASVIKQARELMTTATNEALQEDAVEAEYATVSDLRNPGDRKPTRPDESTDE